jgi:hypothetical protein
MKLAGVSYGGLRCRWWRRSAPRSVCVLAGPGIGPAPSTIPLVPPTRTPGTQLRPGQLTIWTLPY